MKVRSFFPLPRITAAALALSLFTGCGDDEDSDEADYDGPLYAAITQSSVDGEAISYVALLRSVDQTEKISLKDAVEIPGRALGSGVRKAGVLFVSHSEEAKVERFKITAKGKLESDGEVSFKGRGIDNIEEYQHQFQFISDTKAYFVDAHTAQIIVWNPTAMSVTSAIPLPGLAIEGALTSFSTMPVRVGTRLIIPIAWRPSADIAVINQAGVVVIDTTNDSVKVVTDNRCGWVRDSVVGPDNQVYLATEAYGSAVNRLKGADKAATPCLIRFNPESGAFDANFYRELSGLTNGTTTGSLVRGPNGTAYLRVLDEQGYTVDPEAHPRLVASAPAWKFWQLNLSTFTATAVNTLPASSGSTFLYEADDNRLLFTEFTNNSSLTHFRELTDQSGRLVFSSDGLIFSFLQLR
ncbi:hypothetical protein OWM54_41140 [Myxococcus sp. MISCRS1]|uniref:hypothetical protein n=1 Tax=Myxococcus sp. MISCRS1 TaxID=2996786 RepID=UPI0022722762|nr:hypothetical protein [Myxococcus sp. MISCRS1]MCY1003569.1 hypothetical protein [Myxococcus sp. MISCRS1]